MDNSQGINEEVIAVEDSPSNPPSKPPQKRNKPMAQAVEERNGTSAQGEASKSSRSRKVGLLPNASNSESPVTYQGKIVNEMTWTTLPVRAIFSVNADGSHPYFKLSKSSYCDLVTEEVTTGVPPQTSLRVYRVRIA